MWHITWAVNSVSHVWGSQPFNTGDLSRNNWPVGILAFGEGWHNNHHAFEFSARHGLEWWQVDMTWGVVSALAAVGLGRAIDPNATNWDKVQEQLNELLKKAEPTPPPKSPTPPPQQQNQNSNQDSKPQDPKKQPTPPPSKDSSQKQSPKDEASKPQEGGQQGDAGQRPGEPKPPQGKPPGSSAFGDLSPKDKPQHDSQPSTPTQKVGGTREKEPYDPAKADPSLAIPLEKLDQAKTQDQPSELYSLIRRGEPAPPPDKKGKNW